MNSLQRLLLERAIRTMLMRGYIKVQDVPTIMSMITRSCGGGKVIGIEVMRKERMVCIVRLVDEGVLEREFQIQLTRGKVDIATAITTNP